MGNFYSQPTFSVRTFVGIRLSPPNYQKFLAIQDRYPQFTITKDDSRYYIYTEQSVMTIDPTIFLQANSSHSFDPSMFDGVVKELEYPAVRIHTIIEKDKNLEYETFLMH